MKTYKVTVDDEGTFWYNEKDELHREDGPAGELSNGTKYWYRNGLIHRLDGPAVEFANGGRWWYQNGKRHREDGPAIEWDDGSKSWFVEGAEFTKEEFLKRTQSPCEGKIIEIDGQKYRLSAI